MPRLRTPSAADLKTVYERLLAQHGPRHWWPATGGPFEIIVGAILTQNTSWRNVELALAGMQAAGLWSFPAVHAAAQEVLAAAIRSSGYFNTKARKLKAFAAVVEVEFGGSLEALLALDTPALRERLLNIWGIGEETADDIIVYAAGKPSFVIDKYTMRIVDRLGWRVRGAKYADYQALFSRLLPPDVALFNEYHALLDAHASRVCTANRPVCAECCLVDVCRTGGRT